MIHDHSKFDAITMLVKTLTDPTAHHELLIFEGLLALVNISCLDESLRERMLGLGLWSNCKNFLSEKNLEIVITSIELMANLSLSESVTRFTDFKFETDAIIAVYNCNPNDKLAFAVLTYFANTISIDEVKEQLVHDKTELFGNLLKYLTL